MNAGVWFLAVLVAAAIDLTSQLLMWPPYFRFGIPLFLARRRISSERPLSGIAGELSQQQKSSPWIPLRIETVCDGELLFREEFYSWKMMYTPVVHGCLKYNPKSKDLRLVCLANLYPMAFIFALTAAGLLTDLVFLAGASATMLLLLAIQLNRYKKILELAAKLLHGPAT